jgi:hypothetical protein
MNNVDISTQRGNKTLVLPWQNLISMAGKSPCSVIDQEKCFTLPYLIMITGLYMSMHIYIYYTNYYTYIIHNIYIDMIT